MSQIVNSKEDLAAIVRTLTMQRDQALAENERLREALEWAMERLEDPFIQTEGAKIARAALQSKGEKE
jgi:hypothetical protein